LDLESQKSGEAVESPDNQHHHPFALFPMGSLKPYEISEKIEGFVFLNNSP
jgi:hypothetical protein